MNFESKDKEIDIRFEYKAIYDLGNNEIRERITAEDGSSKIEIKYVFYKIQE